MTAQYQGGNGLLRKSSMILDPGSQVRRTCMLYNPEWEWREWEPQGSRGMVGRRQVYGPKYRIFYFVITVMENHWKILGSGMTLGVSIFQRSLLAALWNDTRGVSTVGSHSETSAQVQMQDLGGDGSLVHWERTESALWFQLPRVFIAASSPECVFHFWK